MVIRMQLDPKDQILLRRSLNKNGKGQRFFTSEVRRLSDPYVPRLTGRLKTDATEAISTITYNAPYARRRYYEHKGDGLRGSHWAERMWADRTGDRKGGSQFLRRKRRMSVATKVAEFIAGCPFLEEFEQMFPIVNVDLLGRMQQRIVWSLLRQIRSSNGIRTEIRSDRWYFLFVPGNGTEKRQQGHSGILRKIL